MDQSFKPDNGDTARLDALTQTFGLSAFGIIFQELFPFLLSKASAIFRQSAARKRPHEAVLISYFGIFGLDTLLPLMFYPCSRLMGRAITVLINRHGVPLAESTCIILCYLVFLRGHTKSAFTGLASLFSWDEASWDRLPFDKLIISLYNVWSFIYHAFWFYQLQMSGNALIIYTTMEEVASLITTKGFVVLLLLCEITARHYRWSHGLTLNQVLWEGTLLIAPLEAFSILDAYERDALLMGIVISASEKAIMLHAWIHSHRPAFLFRDVNHFQTSAAAAVFTFEGFTNSSSQIRLLPSISTNRGTTPAYTMSIFPLAGTPDYEAISYTWGDQKPELPITLNEGSFLVTRNAHNIIVDRLSRSRDRWLWIDTICVNQNDNEEKSSQVAIMGSVYRRAILVTIWLDTVPKAVLSDTFLATSLLYLIQQRKLYENRHHVRSGAYAGNLRMWRAFRQLIMHNYWSRLWIIQEISMAKQIQIVYGGLRISGEILIKLVADDIDQYHAIMSAGIALSGYDADEYVLAARHISGIHQCTQVIRGKVEKSLVDVLSTVFQASSKDPRDKMFGFYNMVLYAQPHTGMLGEMKPNYKKSAEDVYLGVTNSLLVEDPGYVFSRAGIGYGERLQALPSYVVDWSEKGNEREKLKVRHESSVPFEHRYHAGGAAAFEHKIDHTSVLHIRGVAIGQVEHMTQTLRPNGYRLCDPDYDGPVDEQARQRFYDQLAKHCAECLSIMHKVESTDHNSRGEHRNLFAETLLGGRPIDFDDGRPAQERSDRGEKFRNNLGRLFGAWQLWGICAQELRKEYFQMSTISARIREDLSKTGPHPSRQLIRSATKFQQMLEGTNNQGHLAIVGERFTAVVPPRAAPHDAIFAVPGLPKPIVLRHVESTRSASAVSSQPGRTGTLQSTSWVLIGDCYVHDFMAGQAFEGDANFVDLVIL